MRSHGYDIVHVDLSRETLAETRACFVVFWWKHLPLGSQAFAEGELPISRTQLAEIASAMIATQLRSRLCEFGGPAIAGVDAAFRSELSIAAAASEFAVSDVLDALAGERGTSMTENISVVVCTRDRIESLDRCLQSLDTLATPVKEVIVVDNSASMSAADCCRKYGFQYVHEAAPGLSHARNAGILAASGSIVAFTDDDVEVAPSWASEIAAVFEADDIDAVTGLVLPAQLATKAEQLFEFDIGGLASNYTSLRFDEKFVASNRRRSIPVWRIGAGANMAFRYSTLTRVGLFDTRLGAGASGCSEDSEMWLRILAAKGVCQYEPRVMVQHRHRSTMESLRTQLRAYFRGHVSALVVQFDRYADRAAIRRIFFQLPLYFLYVLYHSVEIGSVSRLRLLADEIIGWMLGVTYLVRLRWRKATTIPRTPLC